jgi:hypothetical protein
MVDRRTFLKAVAVGVAAAGAPALFNLVDERERIVGMIRETVGADIATGGYFARFDIRTRDVQLGVDTQVPTLDDLPRAREPAITVLLAELEHRGINAADLLPLESLPWA